MKNTTSTRGWRDKYRSATMQSVLRKALVAEKICEVDRSDNYRIQNPYSNQPTATVQAIAGTYTVTAWTQTDDTLTVADEFIFAEHVFDFESLLNNFDLFATRTDELAYAVAYAIDDFVVNNLCEDGTGTYTTPAGGFVTAANVGVIIINCLGKVAGFSDSYKGFFLVVENTDLPGILQYASTSGFSFADAALNNGKVTSIMGVDVHVVRTGTFRDATVGTITFTNDGKRVFGVKGVATYASPRGIRIEEKDVTLKTGKEIVVYGYCGFKLWTQKASLIVEITLA